MKFCNKCQSNKCENNFSPSEFKKSNGRCRKCVKEYYINNKDKIIEQNKQNYILNKKDRLLKAQIYYIKNKDKILKTRNKYIEKNKEKLKETDHLYYLNNKDSIIKKIKEYYINNKHSLNKKKQKYRKNKRINDPVFLLREKVSASIYYYLRNKNIDKGKQSFLNYVPWTLHELINHIENNFEYWMNWNNQGMYIVNEWNDNDQSTWKWQLDHIIPHSKFNYTSMEDEEFKKCWSLENLRPYSAKQNVIDGNRRNNLNV